MNLSRLLTGSAERDPEALAVKSPEAIMSYGELDSLANRIARGLIETGAQRGDRVGIWLDKSACAVAAMQAALRIGAAYVPLDPLSSVGRTRAVARDCAMRLIVTNQARAEALASDGLDQMTCLSVDGVWNGTRWEEILSLPNDPVSAPKSNDNDLAYILYTSGSTGKPKGVSISHRNALAFIDWAARELKATPADRFSNHAPFHFDLSVLDLYAAFKVGASAFLIPEVMSYAPKRLVDFIIKESISIFYSVPSVQVLMIDQGGLLDLDSIAVRCFLFAGEVFPIKYLRRLYNRWPMKRFLNLYGPTETNVCAFYEVKDIRNDSIQPVPIGRACSGDEVWAVKDDGRAVKAGEEGELLVSGPSVMLGYWGHPPQGDAPYATGDIVRLTEDGNYTYVGRRDRMVKLRGYRIELDAIKVALESHPDVKEAAVFVKGSGIDACLAACIVCAGARRPSLLALKRYCAERLPRCMIVDELRFLDEMPRTTNGKIDYLRLRPEPAKSVRMENQ